MAPISMTFSDLDCHSLCFLKTFQLPYGHTSDITRSLTMPLSMDRKAYVILPAWRYASAVGRAIATMMSLSLSQVVHVSKRRNGSSQEAAISDAVFLVKTWKSVQCVLLLFLASSAQTSMDWRLLCTGRIMDVSFPALSFPGTKWPHSQLSIQRFSNWGPRTKGGPRRVPTGSARGFRKVVIVCTVFNNYDPYVFKFAHISQSLSLSALRGSIAVLHDRLSVDVS